MKSFALLVNPITIEQLKKYWPAIKLLPDFLLKPVIRNARAFKASHIRKITSIQGKEIQGDIILCPLLTGRTQQVLEGDFVMDRVLDAGHIAERLGAKILGLSGFETLLKDEDFTQLNKKLKIPVTNGNAYAAWSVFESIYRVAKTKNICLQKSSLAVIGAAFPLGNLCARKLSDVASSVTLVAQERQELENLKEAILRQSPIEVFLEEDPLKAARLADIIVNLNGWSQDLINELKPNAIFCGISPACSQPLRENKRQDISFIKAGLIKLPHPVNLGINMGLPKNIIHACMAETMLLTLEEKFTNYSFGRQTNLDKLEEIADISARHGFEVWVPEAPVL